MMAHTESRYGKAIFYQPFTLKALCLVLLLIFSGFLVFAAFASLKKTQHVTGQLSTLAGEIRVYSLRGGIIQDLMVAEGSPVEQGDVLARLYNAQFDGSGQQTLTMMLEELDYQIDVLDKSSTLLTQRTARKRLQLQSRLESVQKELDLLTEKQSLTDRRLFISEQEYNRARELFENGTLSAAEHNRAMDERYRARQLSNDNLLQLNARQLQFDTLSKELANLPLEERKTRLEIAGSRSRLQASRREIESQGNFSITAPADGRVTNLLPSRGDHLEPRRPLLSIVPDDYTLEAILYVSPAAMSDIAIGQEVMLAYDAYPYQIYGHYEATITDISATVIDPREVLLPVEGSAPVYRIRAALAQQRVHRSNSGRLRPGMRFSAQIVTGEQTILQRILEPLTSLGKNL